MRGVADRVALVTGGGKGIGRAIAARLAPAGSRVILAGRDVGALEQAADEVEGEAVAEQCDVSDEDSVGALFDRVGRVDVLVNNAGVSSSAPLARTELADWEHQLSVNATGAFLCTRAALPGMVERDYGRIVFVASTAAREGTPYTAAYTASKHAEVGLMRSAAAEVAGTGVTSNAVCPTFVRTEMTRRSVERIAGATGRTPKEGEEALVAASPLGRLLEPDEVAAATAFLASDEAASINGQALVLDGGGVQA